MHPAFSVLVPKFPFGVPLIAAIADFLHCSTLSTVSKADLMRNQPLSSSSASAHPTSKLFSHMSVNVMGMTGAVTGEGAHWGTSVQYLILTFCSTWLRDRWIDIKLLQTNVDQFKLKQHNRIVIMFRLTTNKNNIYKTIFCTKQKDCVKLKLMLLQLPSYCALGPCTHSTPLMATLGTFELNDWTVFKSGW